MAEGQRTKPATQLCGRGGLSGTGGPAPDSGGDLQRGDRRFCAWLGWRRRLDSRIAATALCRGDDRPASGDRHQCRRGRGQCVRQSRAARARAACSLASGAGLRGRRIGRRLRRLVDRQGGGWTPAADPFRAADAVRRGDDAARAQGRFWPGGRGAARQSLAARSDRARDWLPSPGFTGSVAGSSWCPD